MNDSIKNQQKINFQKKLDEVIFSLEQSQKKNPDFSKPKLLLHACCGPCSSYVLEYLSKYFQITVYYYNPNIYPKEEYERRILELRKLYKTFPPAQNVQIVEAEYLPQQFYDAVDLEKNPELADEKEKGERCRRCYELRLKRSYEYAKENHFDFFCTTLSISPFKDAEKINEIGMLLAGLKSSEEIQDESPKWLFSDFKKKGGFKRSLELSAEYGMYRQNYCGCVFSKKNSGSE